MAFLAPIAGAGLFGVVGKLLTGGGSKQATPAQVTPLVPSRNQAADLARQADLLRKRRGSAANNVTGGAEASTPGAKVLLGG